MNKRTKKKTLKIKSHGPKFFVLSVNVRPVCESQTTNTMNCTPHVKST